MANIVYALTNPAMPGFVKIGMTDGPDVQARMNSLYSTGVPFPFECAVAWEIEDRTAREVETALHTAFGPNRVNPSREFFEIDPDQVQAVLRVMPGRDVTPRVGNGAGEMESPEREAASEYQTHRAQADEREFMDSLNGPGRRLYRRVLDLGRRDGMLIKWGRKGFSLNVLVNNKNIAVCFGYPPSTRNQALYTGLAVIDQRTDIPAADLDALRTEALETGIFVTAGRGTDLRCATDQEMEEAQLEGLVRWLEKAIGTVREFESPGDDQE